MIVLIIIACVLLILAVINWGQSAGHSKGVFRLFGGGKPADADSVKSVGKAIKKTVLDEFAFDDVYAYDDDPDYCEQV